MMFLYVLSHVVPNSLVREQDKTRNVPVNNLGGMPFAFSARSNLLYSVRHHLYDYFLLVTMRCSRWDIFFARSSRSRRSELCCSWRLAILSRCGSVSWVLVNGELVTGGVASGSCGVFELSMYCRMSLPIDRPTDKEEHIGPVGAK